MHLDEHIEGVDAKNGGGSGGGKHGPTVGRPTPPCVTRIVRVGRLQRSAENLPYMAVRTGAPNVNFAIHSYSRFMRSS